MMNQPEGVMQAQGGAYGPPPGAPPPGGAPMAPAGAPPGGAPMAPPGGGAMPGGVPGMPGGGGDGGEVGKQANTWFIISIVGVFLCCGCWPLCAVGAFFTHQAKGLAAQGQMDEAAAKVKNGKMATIAGMVIAGLLYILYVVVGVVLPMMAS